MVFRYNTEIGSAWISVFRYTTTEIGLALILVYRYSNIDIFNPVLNYSKLNNF